MTEHAAGKPRHGKGPVLVSAVRNFTERGYHGTSMRDIASGADVTVASIYHHFASKQEVLQEIMVQTLSDVISATRSALMGAERDPDAQLGALVHAWILFHTDRQAEALIGASELRSLDDVGRKLVVTLRDEQQRMFQDVIERGVAEGVFTTAYPREAARAVINMGYSVASWYRSSGEVPPVEMANRYVDLALGTVGSRAREQE
jgi:AcrR family transcriptional regulator